MNAIKSNKTRKIIISVVVAIALCAIVNVLMWRASFAGNEEREVWTPDYRLEEGAVWSTLPAYNNVLDKDHLATQKNTCEFLDPWYQFRIYDVWMHVDRSYIDVFYKTDRDSELMNKVLLSFDMNFDVFDNNGNTIMTLSEKTESRLDEYDRDGKQDSETFHANGGKGGSDFKTPAKPVTVICNELVNKGIITKEFADNTSLEELIKCGYVKVKLARIYAEKG